MNERNPLNHDGLVAKDGDDLYAVYGTAEQARHAVKLLVNSGFAAHQLYVLCTDETRREEFRSRLMPAGAAQLSSAPCVVASAGAALGGAVLGGVCLVSGGVAAVAGAAVGAVAGGSAGFLLGAGTLSDDETNRLTERHRQAMEDGKIVVVVRPMDGKDTCNDREAARAPLLAAYRGLAGVEG